MQVISYRFGHFVPTFIFILVISYHEFGHFIPTSNIACVQGSTNGTNGIPISFKVSTNDTIGKTIGTNGNANGTTDSPNGTIGTNEKPMVPLGELMVQLATNGTIGKITNGTIGKPRIEPCFYSKLFGHFEPSFYIFAPKSLRTYSRFVTSLVILYP